MSSTIFSGNSRFASDFQQIITRSLSIAALPLTQLRQQRSVTVSEQTALNALATQFSALQSALSELTANRAGGTAVTVSNSSVASVTASGASPANTLELEVISPGSYSSALSRDGLTRVADPATGNLSAETSFTLTVNGTATTINASGGTLQSLAQAVNAAQAGVQASILNFGSPSSPDYRLAVRATSLGAVSIDLSDSTGPLLGGLTAGAEATYRLNGAPATPISSTSRVVTLAPGVTAELKAAGTTSVSLAADPSTLRNALSAFVTAFNLVVDELDKHRGEAGGALAGQSLTATLAIQLRELANYKSGSGSITSLSHLGVTFDKYGKLQLNPSVFDRTLETNPDAVSSFLGNGMTSGFLNSARVVLDRVTGLPSSVLDSALSGIQKDLTRQDNVITAESTRLAELELSLNERMAKADALIAMLEQQASLIDGIFTAMQSNKND